MNEMLEIGERGRTLMQTGSEACMVWDEQLSRMGTIIYNTTHRIAEDMQHYDAESARRINEITGNLDAITLNINKLKERIWEPS